MNRNKCARGFLFIELLYVLILFGMFALIADHLFISTFKVMTETQAATDTSTRFDAAMKSLRQDLAGASSTDLKDVHTLVIHGGTNEVSWQSKADGSLLRTADDTQHQWDIGQRLDLKKDGGIVLVNPSGDATAALAMVEGNIK